MVKNKAVKEKAVRAVKFALLMEIDQYILQLKRLDPDPLGTETQLLADAEIEVLNLIKDTIDTLKVK